MKIEMKGLSIVIVTKNEQRNIRDCLESARWADEIVIVDAYSTDETIPIAREFTDKIHQRHWEGFGVQKNYAMQQAAYDWIFILDSDERIPVELKEEIQLAIQSAPGAVAGYLVPRKNFFYGQWVKAGGNYPDHQLRLLRKGKGYLDDAEPHNKMVLQGSQAVLKTPLIHLTAPTVGSHLAKMLNFSRLASLEKSKSKKSVGWVDLIFSPLATFFRVYFSKGAWREGIVGLIFTVYATLYTFLKYAKLWELLYVKGKGSAQSSLSKERRP